MAKPSSVFKIAAERVSEGWTGFYIACGSVVEDTLPLHRYLDLFVSPEENDPAPIDWAREQRCIALCLAAAIAESEGK